MNIFVYSDESGVFDKVHNDIYVFGGVVFLEKGNRDVYTRKYKKAENDIRNSGKYDKNKEIKACVITNKQKSKLYRSLNQCIKFGVVINQNRILNQIFMNKKSKQRYLDYAYKIGLKRMFEDLITQGVINKEEVNNISIFADEHTTATDGRYELREGLEQEFKTGTYNVEYNKYFPPIFTNLSSVDLQFCNSNSKILVRAADIVANNIYYKATTMGNVEHKNNLYITYLP
ncbi:DUF3800 domain-containing protein [Clostridium butyricum]|uniref:DUF3800 domain-containing protein n=1 Tax=Clostridium butyricum TaxID=1492 RepID=UPI00374F6640